MSARRQDYIARVRYQSDLPPPPCPPKLLNIPVNVQKLTSWAFLSDLVRKQNPDMDLDMDLGMPLDMAIVPGIFDREDESGCYPLDPLPTLDPRDSLLLKEPAGSSSTTRGPINVSFLRRTEYISSEVVRQKVERVSKKVIHKVIDPESQLHSIEDTFEAANTPMESIVHPRNKKLKPVSTFTVLPDFKVMDLTYLLVKMINSASLSHLKKSIPEDVLSTTLFRPTSLESDEWMSFFTLGEKDAESLKRKLENINDDPGFDQDEDSSKTYKYSHLKDYEMDLIQQEYQFADMAINFEDEDPEEAKGVAWMVPIEGRTNLKRRRVDEEQRQVVAEHNVAGVEMTLHELTPQESISRDNARSSYDSVSYMAT